MRKVVSDGSVINLEIDFISKSISNIRLLEIISRNKLVTGRLLKIGV